MRTICPLDWESVFTSVKKTGRLLVLDTANETCSVAGEIVARVSMELFNVLKTAPQRIALPDCPVPTSPALSKFFYKGREDIIKVIARMVGKEIPLEEFKKQRTSPHDVPGDLFKEGQRDYNFLQFSRNVNLRVRSY